MAGTKFSGFTTGATTANTLIVGYDSVAGTNNQYTLAQLAAGISPSISIDTIYSADGNITTGNDRVVTVDAGGTLQFAGANANGDLTIKGAHGTSLISFWTNGSGNSHLDAYDLLFRVNTAGATDALRLFSTGNASFYKTVTIVENLKVNGQGYTELYDTVNTTLTVDWDNSNIQEITSLTGSHTFTASNPKLGATYILTLGQTGAVTPTWTGVKWPAATAPTLSGAGKTDIITLICYDATGAGLYYGTSTLNYTT